ncbi:hypothetical protein EDB83DRAFT_2670635 [Lactarius deliciosus]|nr:hypothetical protein EDB83DRAFT_2670635 [Lactarius deliciosus]
MEPDRQLSWLHVTHVCHQWRELALNQPFFWSHVDFTTLTPAGATEMFVRAKSVPLYFSLEAWAPKFYWDGTQFRTFQKELQSRVSHICQLAISAEPFSLERVLEGLVSLAPILEYLSLSGKKNKYRKQTSVTDTLFNGSTPKLSRLELRACDISWKSPLFRGLKHLKINSLSVDARPKLSFWLDALEEIPQLKTLVLHSASPITSSVPFDVKHTATLPSLTYFNISASPEDCGLALAHLVLLALISLCVTAFSCLENGGDVQRMLPYVGRHAHGPQDTRPLQSVLIHGYASCVNILAWPVPDIDVEVHDPPTLFATTLSTRDALHYEQCMALYIQNPLREHLGGSDSSPKMDHFWLRYTPRWPLLRRVRLGYSTEQGFITMLLEENGGDESPLLPSLTGLVVVHARVNDCWTNRLCDTLMRRVEQGVPLEVLDLRMCILRFPTAVQLLSEIVVDVLGPSDEITLEWEQNLNMWSPIIRSLEDDNSGAEDDSDTDTDTDGDSHLACQGLMAGRNSLQLQINTYTVKLDTNTVKMDVNIECKYRLPVLNPGKSVMNRNSVT